MIEVVIHGRGGRGGVTLAKLIAGAYFLKGEYVQAFGVYGAERSGAPVQAYVRVDHQEITAYIPIAAPDHVVIIDPSLVSAERAAGMQKGGTLILNTPLDPGAFAAAFPGRRIATIDANEIAVANNLGSEVLPIVNTTMLGAVMKILGLTLADAEAALKQAGFAGPNLAAAATAFERVSIEEVGGAPAPLPKRPDPDTYGFLDPPATSLPTIHTGEWASQLPHDRRLTAVCSNVCPAGNDVRGFLQAAARRDYTGALRTILETSPFPGTCGRVCPAPCMTACNRALLDEAVNIRDVERAVAERGAWPTASPQTRRKRIAVVGSGPAGLSAAYHLARNGFPVTVFEAEAEIGGVLRAGIPSYRLPREVLDCEIRYIARQGVVVKTGHAVGQQELERLSREYDAVFVATGLAALRHLDLDGSCGAIVDQGLDFLNRAQCGDISLAGESVVVVGGGNTAMDAARTALRLGASSVRVVYRRTLAELPAIADEVSEALEEGVEIDELLTPVALHKGKRGGILACRRMRLAGADESGRRRPVAVAGQKALTRIACNRLLLALGQTPDLSVLPREEVLSGCLRAPEFGGALVFAGGDFATGEGTVAAAIGSGRLAAKRIEAALAGVKPELPKPPVLAGPEVISLEAFPRSSQHKSSFLAVEKRTAGFAEVRRGIVDTRNGDPVCAEADRCLSCGACNECNVCVAYCPERALLRNGEDAQTFDYKYCKGCGLCAAQCPRGAIVMLECDNAVGA